MRLPYPAYPYPKTNRSLLDTRQVFAAQDAAVLVRALLATVCAVPHDTELQVWVRVRVRVRVGGVRCATRHCATRH
jgi:hypothetical protein